MSHRYTNYIVASNDYNEVARALSGRAAMITEPKKNSVVVYDRDSDQLGIEAAYGFAEELSRRLQCAVLGVNNFEDDVLSYVLYKDGRKVDEYCSAPSYFDDGASETPEGGDATLLCAAFGQHDANAVDAILRQASDGSKGYILEIDRHRALVEALDVSDYGVGFTFAGLFKGRKPDGLGPGEIIGPP